jgi:hypothetical protein
MPSQEEARESFIRWQGIARDHFSTVSNLALGLSTGLLAFQLNALQKPQLVRDCALNFALLSVGVLFLSVTIAVCCAVNRLRDFRATARIARERQKQQPIEDEDREANRIIGKLSWRLFWWQMALFSLGAGSAAASVVLALWR